MTARKPTFSVEVRTVNDQTEMMRLYDEIRSCTRCPLAAGRTNAVPGVGPVPAEVVFIGEGPGFHEDRQGLPFVGAAGKFRTTAEANGSTPSLGKRGPSVSAEGAPVIGCSPAT